MTGVAYEIPWRKGCYLAKLDGPSQDKWGLVRTFEDGTPVKGRGVLKYELEPGWYEWRGTYRGDKTYIAVDVLKATEIQSESAVASMDRISGGPNPESNGAWGYDRCLCGSLVDSFDGVGFPYCADHAPEAEPVSVLPVPA